MDLFINYKEIKDKHKTNAYDIFTDYVMNIITIEERREARKIWNAKNKKTWEDFIISYVNFIKVGLDPKKEF